jgi:hypothetical protein
LRYATNVPDYNPKYPHLIHYPKTLYIFLGVAASIGLISSIVLYTSSAILISIFNLSPVPEQSGRTATSVRAIQEKKRREQEWQSSTVKNDDLAWRSDVSMAKYAEWLGKRGKGSRREDGLLGQTILEEDDDSDIF